MRLLSAFQRSSCEKKPPFERRCPSAHTGAEDCVLRSKTYEVNKVTPVGAGNTRPYSLLSSILLYCSREVGEKTANSTKL